MSLVDKKTLIANLGTSHPLAFSRALIDNAIVLSRNTGRDGRIGLHAAGAGWLGLLEVYRRGDLLVSGNVSLLPRIKSKNDGRFFIAATGE